MLIGLGKTLKKIYRIPPETFVVIHDITDYGRGHADYFISSVEKLGGKILARMAGCDYRPGGFLSGTDQS